MTKHQMVTFQLHRNGVILVVLGALLVAVLLFGAGYVTAMARGAKLPPVKQPAVPKVTVPKVAVPALNVPKVEAPKIEAPTVEAPTPPAVPPEALTLRVGVYTTEEEATAAMTALAAQKPSLVTEKTSDETLLYIVRVGSYTSRVEAMRAAAELRRQGLDAVIVKQ